MKFKDRIKSYKFWVALSASLVILLQALGDAFGFTIPENIINGITMGFCGVLVVLGVVEQPKLEKELEELYSEGTEENKKANEDDKLSGETNSEQANAGNFFKINAKTSSKNTGKTVEINLENAGEIAEMNLANTDAKTKTISKKFTTVKSLSKKAKSEKPAISDNDENENQTNDESDTIH